MDQIDKIIETGQNILVVNNNMEQNYKLVIELLSKLDKTKYFPNISLSVDETQCKLFDNLGFELFHCTSFSHSYWLNGETETGQKKIVLIDFDAFCKNDSSYYWDQINVFNENVYQIVMSSENNAKKLHKLMGDNIVYICNNDILSLSYIPDPRFVEKKSSWW